MYYINNITKYNITKYNITHMTDTKFMSVISVIYGLTQLNNPHNLLIKRVKKCTCDGRPLCDVTHSHWLLLPFLTGTKIGKRVVQLLLSTTVIQFIKQ